MHVEDSQIKDFIIDAGLVSKSEAEDAEKEAQSKKKPISTILVSKGKFSDDDLRRIQAYILGIPFINLKNQTLNKDILSMIPEPIARKHNIVAFNKREDSLEVAMLDTDDLQALNSIKKKVGLKILPRLTDSESMRSSLIQYQKNLKDDFGVKFCRKFPATCFGGHNRNLGCFYFLTTCPISGGQHSLHLKDSSRCV